MIRHAGLLLLLALGIGCSKAKQIDGTYGRQQGVEGGASVNGTKVLADMFRDAGFEVDTKKRLTPSIGAFDVAVWIPDNYTPPTKKQRDYLESWLGDETNRTLIYVGRDFDAQVNYWQTVRDRASSDHPQEVRRRLALAKANRDRRRAVMEKISFARWYTAVRDATPARVTKLSSPAGGNWDQGIDVTKLGIRTFSAMRPPKGSDVPRVQADPLADSYDVLLASQSSALVMRVRDQYLFPNSQVIVVANGSFLLNLPLVNKEHRKLAGKLIETCGTPCKVMFIESDSSGLQVFDKEPDDRYPTGLEVFTVWPLGAIVMHIMFFGILWCFARWPIFGRPREKYDTPAENSNPAVSSLFKPDARRDEEAPTSTSLADFGQHITALGKMLEQTGDRNYAVAQIEHYQRVVKGESASSAVSQQQQPPENQTTK